MQRGRHAVGRALLGVTPGTQRPVMPADVDVSTRGENTIQCKAGPLTTMRPADISAQVWYPAKEESKDFSRELRPAGKFPLILYAHAKRRWLTCPEHIPEPLPSSFSDYSNDFQRADRMLSHLASHGFVVAAPDLGWLAETFESGDWTGVGGIPRARILRELHSYLTKGFPGVDSQRIGLIGHSTGGAAVLMLQDVIPATKFIGLIAPGGDERILKKAAQSPATLVIVSTLDLQLVRDPELVYRDAREPKAFVRMDGANHLGFTDLCSEDNRVCMDGEPPALMSRQAQQDRAAGYLTAMARRYLLNEQAMAPFLTQP